MKKFGYVIAALATIAIAAPSIANAETVVIKHGGHRDHGWHGGWHRDHWHHHDRTVIIRHGDRHDRTVIIRHGHHHDM